MKYNFNHDKGTPEVFGFAAGDESWEIRNNTSNRVLWKSADFAGTDWLNDFEARYPDKNTDNSKLSELATWLVSTDQSAATNTSLEQAITYGDVTYDRDTAEYRLAKFKNEISDYLELDSALFYYLFTELFLMVDSRAKNAFPTLYNDGKWCWLPYDMDTAIGTNNEGALAFSYELEDIDQTSTGADVYNGQDSVMWINIREAFADELCEMYQNLRSDDVISYADTERRFEEHQSIWPEAIFNEDSYYKYLEPLFKDNTAAYLGMLQGSKSEQRKWWLYNRFRYIDSKYHAGDATKDFITLRGYAKDDITVTPYADIYTTIKYGSYLEQVRALRGNSYTLECPLDNVNDTEIYIYSASQLSSVGDLSGLKVGYAEFSMATRLQALKLGDSSEDYSNANLTELYLGNNTLLKTLDVRNCPNLGLGDKQQAVDISGCSNIEEVYLEGTSITGINLPNGGILKKLHLPSTVSNLTVCNQPSLVDFVMPEYSGITTLRIENAGCVNPLEILPHMAANSRVRILDINIEAESGKQVATFLETLNSMRGLDENGNNVNNAQVSGYIHADSVTSKHEAVIQAARVTYPNLTIEYDEVRNPIVRFYNGDTLLQTVENVPLDSSVAYTGTTPAKPDAEVPGDWRFIGWIPEPVNVINDMNCYAQFGYINLNTIKYIEGSLAGEVYNDKASAVGEYAFQGIDITKISLPNAKTIGDNAFAYLNITEIEAPEVTTIGNSAFWGNDFESVSFPKVVDIGGFTFNQCFKLKNVSFPVATTVGYSAFSYTSITVLDETNFPELINISGYAFNDCNSLTTVNLPKFTNRSMQPGHFKNCSELTHVITPSVVAFPNEYLIGCPKLTVLDLRDVGNLNMDSITFTSLTAFIYRGSRPAKNLSFTGTIPENCPITNGTGYIYFPRNLVDEYKSATNWCVYASQFRALEDYTVDGTITGALDETKI